MGFLKKSFVPKNLKDVTLGDCELAYQMGYMAVIKNGMLVKFIKM